MSNSMKDIEQGLQWLKRQSEFDRDHQAIMLACSRERYLWTSYSTIEKRSGLSDQDLHATLHYLCKIGILYIFITEDKPRKVFFALRERIEEHGGGFMEP